MSLGESRQASECGQSKLSMKVVFPHELVHLLKNKAKEEYYKAAKELATVFEKHLDGKLLPPGVLG